MKHLQLSFILVFCSVLTAIGQTPDFTVVYYPAVNKAEIAITTDQYNDALAYYKRAFESVRSGFARDYRNAILCAIRTKDDVFAFQYLKKLILKGMDKYYFDDQVFEPLRSKKEWTKLMDSYDRLHQESLKNINGEYLRELAAMGDRDQYFRQKEGSYKVFGDTIAKIDLANVLRFQQLVGDYGFPSEDVIGAFISEQNAPYNIVLHHHAQNLSNKQYKYPIGPSLDQIIVQAAQAGKCSPGHAGFLLSLQNDSLLNYCAWGIVQISVDGIIRPYYLLDKIPDSQWNKVNDLRAEIGLESMDDFRLKCQFRLDYPDSPFILSSHQNLNIWDLDEARAKDFEAYFVKLTPTFGK